MKINSTMTYTLIGTLLLSAAAYFLFFNNNGTDATITANGPANDAARAEFQVLISQLPDKFDTSIFEDPNFMSLIDITVPILPETPGRVDPFATINK